MEEWKRNTGEVPEEVTEETVVRVIYRDDYEAVWLPEGCTPNNDPDLWETDGGSCDVIFYKVEEG